MSKRSRALRYYRSYKPQGPIKKVLRFLIKLVVMVFLLYLLVNTFLFQTYSIDQPSADKKAVYAGRVLSTPLLYGPRVRIIDYRFPVLRSPKRGAVVITETGQPPKLQWYSLVLNSLAKFFTFNTYVPFSEDEFSHLSRFQVMRIVGMPGDEIKLDKYRIKIKTPTSSHFIDEQEVIQSDYNLIIPDHYTASGLHKSGTQEPPEALSGSQPSLKLSEGQYMLAPDNRRYFGLSKYWHVSEIQDILSKALLVYWPEFHFL